MTRKKAYLKLLFGLVCLSLLAAEIASLFLGYGKTIGHLLPLTAQYAKNHRIRSLLTYEKFLLIQSAGGFALMCLAVAFYYFETVADAAAFWLKALFRSAKNTLMHGMRPEAKFVLIIPFLASVYYAAVLPVSYDEALTYVNFTSNGVFASACYYPAPNNHILHSLITNLTYQIPFLGDLAKLRISSLFVNVLTWLIAFVFLSRYYGQKFGVAVIAIASMLFMGIYYSYMSRGYGLLMLFFVVSLFASFNIIKAGNQTKDWIWLGIASILGFYSIPSFLYPFLTLQLLIALHGIRFIKKQLVTSVAIALATSILYLPVVIVNGMAALAGNGYVRPHDRSEVLERLPGFFADSITGITGIPAIIILILLCLSLIVMVVKKQKENIVLWLVFLISPFILLLVHSVIPFERTFVYCGFLMIFLILIPFKNGIETGNRYFLMFTAAVLQLALLYNFNSRIYPYEDYDIVSDQVLEQLKGGKSYVVNDGLFDALLIFRLKSGGFRDYKVTSYYDVGMSADSVRADFIIIRRKDDKTVQRKPVLRNNYFSVY